MKLAEQGRKRVTESATRYGHSMTRWFCAPNSHSYRSHCKHCGAKVTQDGWGEMHGTATLFYQPCPEADTIDTAYVEATINDREMRFKIAQGIHPMYT